MEDERKKDLIIYAIIAVLVLALCACFWADRRRNVRRMQELTRQSQQLNDESVRNRQKGEEIYWSVKDQISGSIPGFVCWGDECAAGNGYGSLETRLASRINSALVTDLEDSFRKFSGLYYMSHLDIPVENMGVTNEGFYEILARAGVKQVFTAEDIEIPAGAGRRDMRLCGAYGGEYHFSEQKYVKFGTTTVLGVDGRLYTGSTYYDDLHFVMAFERNVAGEAVTVPAGTQVTFAGSEQYPSYIPVLFFGEQEGVPADIFIDGLKGMIARSGRDDDAYVVICSTPAGSELDTALTQAFIGHYIQCDKSAEDLRLADLKVISDQIYYKLDALGCFDGVKQAVGQAAADLAALSAR